jgi:hypothetical protein
MLAGESIRAVRSRDAAVGEELRVSRPVFKKMAETKKSTPSDSVGFKNRLNSVKFDKN